jgi:FtsH-binding integral membrane protein
MNRLWGSVLPLVYVFLFAGLMRQYEVQFTPVVYWAFIGGIVFSSALGIYLDGRIPGRSVLVFGLFTLIWLILGLKYRPEGNPYVFAGILMTFVLSIVMQKIGK